MPSLPGSRSDIKFEEALKLSVIGLIIPNPSSISWNIEGSIIAAFLHKSLSHAFTSLCIYWQNAGNDNIQALFDSALNSVPAEAPAASYSSSALSFSIIENG